MIDPAVIVDDLKDSLRKYYYSTWLTAKSSFYISFLPHYDVFYGVALLLLLLIFI